MADSLPPLVIVTGSDPVLLDAEVDRRVDELLADADRSLAHDKFMGDEYELAQVIDGAQTPPMFADRRVVVARNAARFGNKEGIAPLVSYLSAPLESSAIVLVWEKGVSQQRAPAVPKSLKEAAKAAGVETISTAVPSGRGRSAWFDTQLAAAGVSLTRDAERALVDTLGDDVNRLGGLLDLLEAVHGSGSQVDLAGVEPYLGEAGAVPPWELTDAIEKGDIALALDRLHRMMGAGGRHPLQIMASIQTQVSRWLALDGADVSDERAAAALLGMKGSTFPAKKALTQSRRLDSRSIGDAVRLVATADRDLRGESGWPPELVMEVLVARLTRLVSPRR